MVKTWNVKVPRENHDQRQDLEEAGKGDSSGKAFTGWSAWENE